MALKDIQTNKNDLQEYLLLIAKVPEKVNKIDIDIKKELLIDIDNRISSITGTICEMIANNPNYNYPGNYPPDKLFEYWASKVSQLFNYNELKSLRVWIESSIKQSKVDVRDNDLETKKPKNIYLGYPTNESANKLFEFLIEYYRAGEKTSVKYVNIHYYLKNNANKDLYIFNLKQSDFKQIIKSIIGIEIKKFEKSEKYNEVEKPILNSLEYSFRN